MKDNHSMNIQIDDVVIAIRCSDAYAFEWLVSRYKEFLCEKAADLDVEVSIVGTMTSEEVFQHTRKGRFFHHDGLFDFDTLVIGNYNSNSVHIEIERTLMISEDVTYYLNQLIGWLYYTSKHNHGDTESDSRIVHSSAVILNGCGLLFTGRSGIGKTTMARLCRDYADATVINDEGNLVSLRPDEPPLITGIPIIGKLSSKKNTSQYLDCLLLLKQSSTTHFRRLDRADIVKRLLYQICGFQYLGQNDIQAILQSKMRFIDELTQRIPCFELNFALDGDEVSRNIHELLNTIHEESRVYVG